MSVERYPNGRDMCYNSDLFSSVLSNAFFATAKRTLFFYSPSSTQNVIAVGPCDQLLSAVAAAAAAWHGSRSIGSR